MKERKPWTQSAASNNCLFPFQSDKTLSEFHTSFYIQSEIPAGKHPSWEQDLLEQSLSPCILRFHSDDQSNLYPLRIPNSPESFSCRSVQISATSPYHKLMYGVENVLRGAQELDNIIKQGYLEKKSKDHSFFGSEWQRRWCVVSRGLFLYYANEKSKQPKGTFLIKGYSVRMAPHLRKDSKKESCFELTSQDRRSYEEHPEGRECASHPHSPPPTPPPDLKPIFFPSLVLTSAVMTEHLLLSDPLEDLSSLTIPCEEEEEEEKEEEEMYDDIDGFDSAKSGPQCRAMTLPEPAEEEEDIYEVLPVDYASYHWGLWDCHGGQPDELSFQRGDLIRILSKQYNVYGWWVGELNSLIGIVPKDYLTTAFETEEP
ncbi:hypothetical protein STEG23_035137 [Scotinomys teguina]